MCNQMIARKIALTLAVLLGLFGRSEDGLASGDTATFPDLRTAPARLFHHSAGQPYTNPGPVIPRDSASLQITTDGPFDSSTSRVAGGQLAHLWQGVERGVLADMAALALCRATDEACSPAIRVLRNIIAEGRSRDGLARLGVINRSINLAIKPTTVPYVWHSSLEALSTGEGDCKDYAVAKYVAILEAGFAEQDVKLVIVHDTVVNQDHVVVTVRFNGDWMVLDNRWLALVRDVDFPRSIPLYVLDENGVRRFSQQRARSNSPAQTTDPP